MIVVGAGKATSAMAQGLEKTLGGRIDDGCVIVKYGHSEPLGRIRQMEAGHPVPDRRGLVATRELLRLTEGLTAQDRVFVLLSGGASALLVAPAEGVTLEDKAAVTDMLLRCDATIEEINAVRRGLSRVKGGGLLRHIGPAESMTLMISDVPGGELSTVGSGPMQTSTASALDPIHVLERKALIRQVPEAVVERLRKWNLERDQIGLSIPNRSESLLLADSKTLQGAVAALARERGLELQIVDGDMRGNTHEAALSFVAAMRDSRGDAPRLFMSAGETTLQVRGPGRGGRNQEFALTAAKALAGQPGFSLLAAGTDGTDGPTDAAGAFADGQTYLRARDMGIDPEEALLRNDSHSFFHSLGDLYCSGPTGTNVMDLVLGISPGAAEVSL